MSGENGWKKPTLAAVVAGMLLCASGQTAIAAKIEKFNNASLKGFRCVFSMSGGTPIQAENVCTNGSCQYEVEQISQPISLAGVLEFDGVGTATLEYELNENGASDLTVAPLPTVGYVVNPDGTGYLMSVASSSDPSQPTFWFAINSSITTLTLTPTSMFANLIGSTLYTGPLAGMAGNCAK